MRDAEERIARRWDRYAGGYDRFVRLDGARRRSLQLANPRPGEQIAILGIGTGRDLPLLPKGVQVTALDLSPAMLQRARERATAAGVQVHAEVGNAEATGLPDDAFDLVVLHLIIAVASDPVQVVREAARIVRPAGRIVVLDKFAPEGRSPSLVRRALHRIARPLATSLLVRLQDTADAAGVQVLTREAVAPRAWFEVALLAPPAQPANPAQPAPSRPSVRSPERGEDA